MSKRSQVEKAIAELDAEISVLQAVRARLVAHQPAKAKPVRRPRAVPAGDSKLLDASGE